MDGGPGGMGGFGDGNGGPGGGMGGFGDGNGGPGGMGGFGDGNGGTDGMGGPGGMRDFGDGNGGPGGEGFSGDMEAEAPADAGESITEEVGTPDAGTTQSASSGTDSNSYSSFEEMVAAYQADIAEIQSGDAYGNNIVELYNPLNYIGAEDTTNPTWARILCGASEGDISMFNSLNLEIAWLNAGTAAEIEWQWDGGHVPSEILGDSLSLYVDTMSHLK